MASRGTDLLTISGYVSSCRPSPNPSREALCTCSADRSWEFGEQETKASPPSLLPHTSPIPLPLCTQLPPTHTHTHPTFTPCYALSSSPPLLTLCPLIAHTSTLNRHVVHMHTQRQVKLGLSHCSSMLFYDLTFKSKL